MVDPRKLDTANMDLTGKFPYISRRGNQYILVGYHYDANYIAAVPIKKRTAGEITKGWEALHSKFSKGRVTPTKYVMDNDTSKELIAALEKKQLSSVISDANKGTRFMGLDLKDFFFHPWQNQNICEYTTSISRTTSKSNMASTNSKQTTTMSM